MRRLATATYELGDPRRARELREQAVKTAEEGLNATHPAVGLFLNDYAVSLLQDEDYVEGAKVFTRALAIFEKLGPKSATTTVASYNLGVTLVEMGDHVRARPYLERALANWRELVLERIQPTRLTACSASRPFLGQRGGLLSSVPHSNKRSV